MKFTNGHWLMQPGVVTHYCADVRNIEISDTKCILYAASSKIYNRGQTLGGPLFTLIFKSYAQDTLSIEMVHYMGNPSKGPEFNIQGELLPIEVQEQDNILIISSGKLSAKITKEPFEIKYYFNNRFLTSSKPRQLAYMTTNNGAFMRERLHAGVDEYFYGMGERFTPFIKNGQVIDIWNEDGGTASEQAYKNVPFYMSNKGYGVLVNHPERVSFEVCSEIVSKVQFSVEGERMEYMIFAGENLSNVLTNYTLLLGRPALPPAWSFGLWLSTSFTTDYNEATVTSFIDGMKERDIPLSVFHFDCFWMKEYQWCNFQWDTDAFPDPEAMIARLKSRGLKICLWINPYIGQRSPLFAEGMQNGYLIKNKDGSVWQWDLWQPGLAIVDFTNPLAVIWYQNHLKRLMAQGVDCFKTDFGERIPIDVCYYDESNPKKMHNYYSYLFNKTVFDIVKEVKGEAVLFARSATAGGQQFPVHWGGDCDSDFESMSESLRGGLSLSMCGFGFWSHDIGGFENTATPDVYKRWVAFGLFSSHSRLHGSISYRVPWLFDEEAVDVLRFFTQLKNTFMPYIYSMAVKAHKTGIPIMRPMVLEYNNDPVCVHLDKQYMFGDSLLIAPVFNEEGETRTYLPLDPEGKPWTNWFTGEKVAGGQFVNEKHDYFSLGVWVKPNSIIPLGRDDCAEYDYTDSPMLQTFQVTGKKDIVIEGIKKSLHITIEYKNGILENDKGFLIVNRS